MPQTLIPPVDDDTLDIIENEDEIEQQAPEEAAVAADEEEPAVSGVIPDDIAVAAEIGLIVKDVEVPDEAAPKAKPHMISDELIARPLSIEDLLDEKDGVL